MKQEVEWTLSLTPVSGLVNPINSVAFQHKHLIKGEQMSASRILLRLPEYSGHISEDTDIRVFNSRGEKVCRQIKHKKGPEVFAHYLNIVFPSF